MRNYARIESTPLVLAGLLGIFALLTVGNLLISSVRRRRRDLAILKTLGLGSRQLSSTVAWQATVITVLALALGMPLGAAIGLRTWRAFADNLGAANELHLPVTTLVIGIPALLLIANLIALVPARAARRLHPGTALRTE